MATATITLEAQSRAALGSASSRRLRRQGLIPAVLYGKKVDNVNLVVDGEAFESVLRQHGRILDVKLPDGTLEKAMIREVQYDPFGDEVLHVDFSRIALDEKIKLPIEIEYKGEAKGTKTGGIFEVSVHSLEVECLAGNIPEKIVVDVSELDIDQVLRVKDVKSPEGARLLADPETAIARVAPPRLEEEVAAPAVAAAEAGAAEPEVIAKGKKEEEEGEAAEKE